MTITESLFASTHHPEEIILCLSADGQRWEPVPDMSKVPHGGLYVRYTPADNWRWPDHKTPMKGRIPRP